MSRVGVAMAALLGNRTLFAGLTILVVILLVAIFGPMFVDIAATKVGATIPRQPPSPEHWLGTDGQGRDMFATMIHAMPQTLRIGLTAGLISLSIGVALGLIAGFTGGIVDTIIRLASDVMMTIPGIAILVLVASNVRIMTVDLMAIIVASLSHQTISP